MTGIVAVIIGGTTGALLAVTAMRRLGRALDRKAATLRRRAAGIIDVQPHDAA